MGSWNELALPLWSENNTVNHQGPAAPPHPWHMLDALDVGIGLWSQNGVLVHCNSAFQQAFGAGSSVCQPGAALQQILVLACMSRGAQASRNEWVDAFLSAFHNCAGTEWRSAQGKWWRVQFWPYADNQRLCRILDISTEKRLEQECRHLADVSNSETSLTTGLAHMGHELRTPLNAILGFSDLIRSEAIGPLGHASYAEYAHDIYNSGQVLLTAVDRIALLVKLEAGLIRPQSANISCKSLALSTIEATASIAATAEVQIDNQVAADSPTLFVDQHLLISTLAHLLENAIAATVGQNSVELRCVFEPGDGLAFEVRDTGPGIPSDQLDAIRQPFVRLDSTNPKSPAGVGMGLPLADRMAALLNCTIALDSTPGAGTSARLLVPSDRVVAE
jgi:two-component system, cell cycle sensor histidine kinase PleC